MTSRGGPIGAHFMIGFSGTHLPGAIRNEIAAQSFAGATLFRFENVESAEQVRSLTSQLQAANRSELPLLIAADQETGQLHGLGLETTAFPGAMALGATRDPELARAVGEAIGRECLALGVNVNYAPVCDVATREENPSLGIRSFGDDPALVGSLAAAMATGMLGAGVIPVLKHFPGKGEAAVDPHDELPVLDLDMERLERVELAPFAKVIAAGAPMVMVGHYGLPAVTGSRDLPSSTSALVVEGLLRSKLAFDGVVITDALDMGAFGSANASIPAVVAALRAGVDLLLCSKDDEVRRRMMAAVETALENGMLAAGSLDRSRRRVEALRRSVARSNQPDLDVVGCADHLRLAKEVARRSITVLRGEGLPVKLGGEDRVMAVMPAPADLTPADTSSTVRPTLAEALRRHHPNVTELITSTSPTDTEIQSVIDVADRHQCLVVGTTSADERQGALVTRLIETRIPTVTVAMRTPYDLRRYPTARTHLVTYSIQHASMSALADVIFGLETAPGTLPVSSVP